jgi:hypothetical protein
MARLPECSKAAGFIGNCNNVNLPCIAFLTVLRAFQIYYNPLFANFAIFCICLHLAIIVFEAPNHRTEISASWRVGLLLLELFLSCVHLFDTYLKILHMGKKEFFSKGWNSVTFYYRAFILFVRTTIAVCLKCLVALTAFPIVVGCGSLTCDWSPASSFTSYSADGSRDAKPRAPAAVRHGFADRLGPA